MNRAALQMNTRHLRQTRPLIKTMKSESRRVSLTKPLLSKNPLDKCFFSYRTNHSKKLSLPNGLTRLERQLVVYASEVLLIAQKWLAIERLVDISGMRQKSKWDNVVVLVFLQKFEGQVRTMAIEDQNTLLSSFCAITGCLNKILKPFKANLIRNLASW